MRVSLTHLHTARRPALSHRAHLGRGRGTRWLYIHIVVYLPSHRTYNSPHCVSSSHRCPQIDDRSIRCASSTRRPLCRSRTVGSELAHTIFYSTCVPHQPLLTSPPMPYVVLVPSLCICSFFLSSLYLSTGRRTEDHAEGLGPISLGARELGIATTVIHIYTDRCLGGGICTYFISRHFAHSSC